MPLPSRIKQWWPMLLAAAHRVGVDVYILAAVMDRESLGGYALTPTGPSGTGDHGHGLGLMQIDARFHPAFALQRLSDGTFAWQDPQMNINKGAEILEAAFRHFEAYGDVRTAAAVAAYNADAERVQAALDALTEPASLEAKLDACDFCTTHRNYSSDVLERAQRFRAPANPSSPPPPTQEFS